MGMRKFNSELLRIARESRFITQEELATAVGVEQGTLSKIEKVIQSADAELVNKIADSLSYPVDFFYQEKKVLPVEGHYRRKVTTPVKKMKQYIAQMTLAEWQFMSMLDEIELPETKMPTWDVMLDGGPSLCAKFLRDFWKIPKGRITNLTKMIEDNGIVIIALDIGDLDGFSTFFNGSIPVIFINKKSPADRYRLTLAHELGHLIMHFRSKVGPERDLEDEAYKFAIELLVPENSIRPYFSRVTLEKLADLKAYWYVSMGALLKYANSLGIVTGNQYRYLWMQMGSLGYRSKEPISIPDEKPGLINEMIKAYLFDLGYSKAELASTLYLSVAEFERIYLNSKIRLKAV